MYKLHTCVKEFSPLSSSSLGRRRRRKTSFLFPGGDRRKEKPQKGWMEKSCCCCCPICEREKSFIMLQLLCSQQKCEFDPENWAFYGGNRDHCRVRIGKRLLLPSWSSCTAEHAVSHKRILLIPLPFSFVLPPFPFSVFPAQLHSRNTNQLGRERKGSLANGKKRCGIQQK